MSKGNIAFIAVGLFIVSLIGFNFLVADGSEDNPVTTSIRDGAAETTTKQEASTEAVAKGVYTNYSQSELTASAQRGDRTVLFFHAEWCPTCKGLARNLKAGIVPDGLSILQLDFDTDNDLRQKYGVTLQHTLVEIDGEGNEIDKWVGGQDVNDILAELDIETT